MILGQLLINGHVTAVSMPEGPKPASLSECPADPLEISARLTRKEEEWWSMGVGWWVNVPSLELSKKGAPCWGAVIPIVEMAS